MDALALLRHPAVVAVIVIAIVAVALVLIRRRRRAARPPVPPSAPESPSASTDAAYLDSSHILEGPIAGDAARRGPPHDR